VRRADRTAASGRWVLNEKRMLIQAGLGAFAEMVAGAAPARDPLRARCARVRAWLDLGDPEWTSFADRPLVGKGERG